MNVGFWEVLTLGVLALLIFGPERLPGIARSVGQTVGRFKREANATLEELKRAADLHEFREVTGELRSTAGELRSLGTDLRGSVNEAAAGARTTSSTATSDPGAPAPFDPDAT